MSAPSTEPFNHDMIMEILSRSSLQTLSTCRLLSKELNALTYESFFRNLHSQRTRVVYGIFTQVFRGCSISSQFISTTDEKFTLNFDFLPFRVQIVATTNIGILLCVNNTPRIPEYYVCKPSTKQYKRLPNPKTRYPTLGTGVIVVKSNPLCFKIVRISEPMFWSYDSSTCCNYRTEIFDSKTWAWKQLKSVSLPYGVFLEQKPAISIGGSLYWQYDKTILAYHRESDCCSVFSLPEEVQENQNITLIAYEGRLGVVCDKGDSIELWLMKINNNEKVWFKRLVMSSEELRKEDRSATCLNYYGKEIIGFSGVDKFIFCEMKKKSIDEHEVWSSFHAHEVFHFQSDYEPVNFYARRR